MREREGERCESEWQIAFLLPTLLTGRAALNAAAAAAALKPPVELVMEVLKLPVQFPNINYC